MDSCVMVYLVFIYLVALGAVMRGWSDTTIGERVGLMLNLITAPTSIPILIGVILYKKS